MQFAYGVCSGGATRMWCISINDEVSLGLTYLVTCR